MALQSTIAFHILCVFLLICTSLGANKREYQEISGEKKEIRSDVQVAPVAQTTATIQQNTSTVAIPTVTPVNCTGGRNGTDCHPNSTDDGTWASKIPQWMDKNKGILERTMYVLIVLTVIVVLYFLIKMIRLRRRRSKTRRYGVLNTNPGDNLEMTPLDQEDDEDDMTVFEVNGHRK